MKKLEMIDIYYNLVEVTEDTTLVKEEIFPHASEGFVILLKTYRSEDLRWFCPYFV